MDEKCKFSELIRDGDNDNDDDDVGGDGCWCKGKMLWVDALDDVSSWAPMQLRLYATA